MHLFLYSACKCLIAESFNLNMKKNVNKDDLTQAFRKEFQLTQRQRVECPRFHTREIKQLRRPRRRQLEKTIGLMIKTTALHVHHAF